MKEAVANASVPFAWGAWLLGHISEINQILQAVAFTTAIIASVAAAWYHIKKGREQK